MQRSDLAGIISPDKRQLTTRNVQPPQNSFQYMTKLVDLHVGSHLETKSPEKKVTKFDKHGKQETLINNQNAGKSRTAQCSCNLTIMQITNPPKD